jgi:hypothetical protein
MDFRDRLRFTVQPNEPSRSPEANYHRHEPADRDDHRGGRASPNNDPAASPPSAPRPDDEGAVVAAEPSRVSAADEDRFHRIFSGVLAAAAPVAAAPATAVVLDLHESDPSDALDEESGEDRGGAGGAAWDLAKMQDRLRLEAAAEAATTVDGASAACRGCGARVPSYCGGVFCANAFSPRVRRQRNRQHSSSSATNRQQAYFPPCFGVWCGSCYSIEDEALLPLPSLSGGINTDNIRNDQQETPYRTARNGDHLMTMFQCEACHFANIQGREPRSESETDRMLLRCIRRATLDAFWGAAPTHDSVEENRQAFELYLETVREFGAPLPLPPPFPLEDGTGMAVAAAIVAHLADSSRESGEGEGGTAHEKFAQALAMRDAVHNLFEATTAVERRPSSSVAGPWFERFLDGLHLRVLGAPRADS